MDERRSIGERLEGAQRAGDLRLRRRRSDIDYIIASGFTAATGIILHRLVSAFEAIDQSTKVLCPAMDRKEQRRRVLIRLDLPMLEAARAEVLQFAMVWGPRRGFDLTPIDLPKVVNRAVEMFLDDVCDECHGTKVVGVYGGVQPMCRRCKGTGTRSATLGRGEAEQDFGGWLILEMGQMLTDAEAAVARELGVVDMAKQWLADQTKGTEYITAS